MKRLAEQKNLNRRIYWSVISWVALSCGGAALAQSSFDATNAVPSVAATNITDLGNVTVVGKLDQARDQISPDLGATVYSINKEQIDAISQGDNAPFSQIILRAPGVAQDNAASGGLHVRGEHANLQYRINDVLLPEGISGFGLELDPRFVDSMQLITGALPAQYGFRTAGVVDIRTKSGAFDNGGDFEMYGGSYDTIRPSFEYGGTQGKFSYFVDGSYDHSALGIENPTSAHSAIHNDTDQFKGFTYLSYLIDDTSRVSFIGSASYSNFEIPNTPGLQDDPDNYSAPGGAPWYSGGGILTTFDSADLNEQQREQNYYGVVTYQKQLDDLNLQISGYGRASGVHFRPDEEGDLFFNGVASDDERKLYSGGLQADASYDWDSGTILGHHTFRGGAMLLDEVVFSQANTTVFPMDASDNPGGPPETISQNDRLRGLFSGIYLQDEWKLFSNFTINYGARFDDFTSSFDNEYQLSPRVNLIFKPTESTTLHAGYARYFTPPPVEDVSGSDVAAFNGTSNGSDVQTDDPVKAERADYFDVGISQKITKHFTIGVDGYYKYAHNQLDDGLFGQSLILSAFNYARGRVFGIEPTASFTWGGFSAYANIAWSQAKGENWTSSQFLFGADDLAYVNNHWIYLDHDQRVTGSFGMSYLFKEGDKASTKVYVDALYGSGLRTDSDVPNGGSIPSYYSINLGAEQSFKIGKDKTLKVRLDVVNLTDNSYELRDGGGVGINAASYGERLGFFGSLSFVF